LSENRKQRPAPADFGVSEADIDQVKQQDARAARLKRVLNLASALLGCSSFVWAGYVVAGRPELSGSWYGLVCYFGLVGASFWAAAAVEVKIGERLHRVHPKSEPVHRYQRALAAFEDWWVRTKAEHWQRLPGRKFELELARLFNAIGWEAKPTPASRDRGIDIEAQIDEARVIVQCKAHKKPVSPGVARELFGTLLASEAQSAILASVSGFGPGVREFVAGKSIKLIDLTWILEKQQGLDLEKPLAVGGAGMAARIRHVIAAHWRIAPKRRRVKSKSSSARRPR
jgi:restriction system protein